MRKINVLFALGLLIPFTVAANPEEKGRGVAEEAKQRDIGFHDYSASMEMILKNRHGQVSTRLLRNRTLEREDDGDRLLILFDEPRDVKGTAFLAFSHRVGQDDQWLYLPALKRVKRISSNNKSGPFMGSEFAYEDLTSAEVEKYTYRYLREETLNGTTSHVIERIPVDPKSGYKRQEVWYDQEAYRMQKVVFYDRKGDLLKTLTYSGYQKYLETYWRADHMLMVNHQTGKTTELKWQDYSFQTGLSERDFDRNSLKRAR